MEPTSVIFDISRDYICDQRCALPEDLYLRLHGANRARDIKTLATCSTFLSPNIGRDGYRTLLQVEAFFKKNLLFTDPGSCERAARLAFFEAEEQCAATNRRLDVQFLDRSLIDSDVQICIRRMERFVEYVLGDFRSFLDNLPKLVRVTAGATSTRSRRRSLPHLRISKKPSCTSGAVPYLESLSQYYGYGSCRPRICEANRVEFVPKNWKTYRTIACEPEGNVFLQLAVDSYVKDRLRKFTRTTSGESCVNLRSQFRNQRLAREGSISGLYSTIDLSMASDTLALNTIHWLVPEEWRQFLCAIRSPFMGGSVPTMPYEKFSSMGNGSTFVLESLVFAAAAFGAGDPDYAVYGDDIVVGVEYESMVRRLLDFFGFTVNSDKSFNDGPFRESCGINAYEGVDITPVYVRKLDRRKATQCHLINSLMTITHPGADLWKRLILLCKTWELPFVPYDGITTSGVWVNSQTARKMKLLKTRRNWGPWQLVYKSYRSDAQVGHNYDSRSLFLWYLDSQRRGSKPGAGYESHVEYEGGDDFLNRSRYTVSGAKYRRKWVHYREVVAGAPAQLDCWSEDISPS